MLPPVERVVLLIPTGSGGTDLLEIDACTQESHALENTVTEFAVETGAAVSDHSRPVPRKLQLECVITNAPLDGAEDGRNYALEAWAALVDLHERPRLVAVSTARDYYESMAVESVSTTVDAKTAQALRFTATLRQVRVVRNKFTRVVVSASPRAHAAKRAGKVMTNKVEATDPDAANVSALVRIVDAAQGGRP